MLNMVLRPANGYFVVESNFVLLLNLISRSQFLCSLVDPLVLIPYGSELAPSSLFQIDITKQPRYTNIALSLSSEFFLSYMAVD
jgi:hypothetical protein